jgi:hypothetical protein
MNRRNFIGSLLTAGAGFAILPPAATARIWKAIRPPFLEWQPIGALGFTKIFGIAELGYYQVNTKFGPPCEMLLDGSAVYFELQGDEKNQFEIAIRNLDEQQPRGYVCCDGELDHRSVILCVRRASTP